MNDSRQIRHLETRRPENHSGHRVHAGGILDHWARREWTDGVQLEQLEDLDTLAVETRNSTYHITVLSRFTGDVLVQGGRFFPQRTPACLAGSSLGGSFLKIRGIYLDFSLEFQHDGRRIVTSRVKSIGMVLD